MQSQQNHHFHIYSKESFHHTIYQFSLITCCWNERIEMCRKFFCKKLEATTEKWRIESTSKRIIIHIKNMYLKIVCITVPCSLSLLVLINYHDVALLYKSENKAQILQNWSILTHMSGVSNWEEMDRSTSKRLSFML